MSSLSVSTSSEFCRHLFELLYFYCVKSRIQRTQLDGKKKIDYFDSETFGIGCGLLQCMAWGGQSGAAVRRPHGMHQDMGSNPAAARQEKTHIGQTPAQKVPQLCGRI